MLRLCYHQWPICLFALFQDSRTNFVPFTKSHTFNIVPDSLILKSYSLPATKWFVQEKSQELVYSITAIRFSVPLSLPSHPRPFETTGSHQRPQRASKHTGLAATPSAYPVQPLQNKPQPHFRRPI